VRVLVQRLDAQRGDFGPHEGLRTEHAVEAHALGREPLERAVDRVERAARAAVEPIALGGGLERVAPVGRDAVGTSSATNPDTAIGSTTPPISSSSIDSPQPPRTRPRSSSPSVSVTTACAPGWTSSAGAGNPIGRRIHAPRCRGSASPDRRRRPR
jgi:hypothetical protein